MNLSKTLRQFGRKASLTLKKYAPQILAGASIAGAVTTTVLAVKATVKAVRHTDEVKEELGVDELSATEIVKENYKFYIPTAVSLTATVATGVLSCVKSTRKIAALTSMYNTAITAKEEFMEASREIVGKKKTEEIEAAVTEKELSRDDMSMISGATHTRYGNVLFKESESGQYFYSSYAAVQQQIAEYNNELIGNEYQSLNELCYKFEIPHDSGVGDEFGWRADTGLVDMYTVDSHHPLTHEPCAVIKYHDRPIPYFYRSRW